MGKYIKKFRLDKYREPNPMDEVFFYDPYEKKVNLNILVDAASAFEAFRKLQKSLIEAGLSCNDLEEGMKKCHAIHGKQ